MDYNTPSSLSEASEIIRSSVLPDFHPSTPHPTGQPGSRFAISSTPSTSRTPSSGAPRISRTTSTPLTTRVSPLNDAQKMHFIFQSLQEVNWTVNQFLSCFFDTQPRAQKAKKRTGAAEVNQAEDKEMKKLTETHERRLQAALDGTTLPSLGTIVDKMYQGAQITSYRRDDTTVPAEGLILPSLEFQRIKHALPSLRTWAVQCTQEIVEEEGRKMMDERTGLRLHAKSTKGKKLVTWKTLEEFSIRGLHDTIRKTSPAMRHVTMGFMGGTVSVEKRNRPAELVSTETIMAMIAARNRNVNYLAMCFGIWFFSAKAPYTVFRVESRLGRSVAQSTVYAALRSMSQNLRLRLQKSKKDFIVVIDNTQAYARAREARFGKESRMITGLAGTAVELEDVVPGAFNLDAYMERVIKMERKNLTTTSILQDVDFEHLKNTSVIQFLQRLFVHVDVLEEAYGKNLKEHAKTTVAKNPIPDHRHTKVHPLATNSADELSVQKLDAGVTDFMTTQLGVDADTLKNKVRIMSGDGKTFNMLHSLRKYKSFQDTDFDAYTWLLPLLEIWHTIWTDLSRVVRAHWGDSDDPSSLAYLAKSINAPTPSDLRKVDYYNGAHLVDMVLNALILNAWELWFDTDDLRAFFQSKDELPSFEDLIAGATTLAERYSTSHAFRRARHPSPNDVNAPPDGSPWSPKPTGDNTDEAAESSRNIPRGKGRKRKEREDDLPPLDEPSNTSEEGDTVLANISLFMRDALLWCEARNSVSEGDPGRIWEVFKSWIFTFAGSGNPLYCQFLMELYCGFTWEFGEALTKTILSNWLVNLHGTPGHFVPMDLMQEHNNFWLEGMVQSKGKEFDEDFYRNIISPNVQHFLRLKDEVEEMVSLHRRTKRHKSPSYEKELQALRSAIREEELLYHRAGRYEGHQADDDFTKGFDALEKDRVKSFVRRSTLTAAVLKMRRAMQSSGTPEPLATDLEGDEDELQSDELNPTQTTPNQPPPRFFCTGGSGYYTLDIEDEDEDEV